MGQVGTEATLQLIYGKVTNIEAYVDILANGYNIDDWGALKILVQNGTASREYPVGTYITDAWSNTSGTSYNAQWDVTHYDDDGNMYLKWHYAIPDAMPFDQPEALYYAPSGGITAGTYYITIGTSYGSGWVAGEAIEFTLNYDMDEGDQLVISTATSNNTVVNTGIAWNVYASGSTTSKDSGTTSSGTTGTSLGTTSTSGVNYTNGNINAPQRVVYGYNRWSQSAIRQYLNSSADAGSWWTVQNGWDRPPSVATTLNGFLSGCSSDFINAIEAVDVVTALNTADAATESVTYETTSDKIFLPSLQEMYISPQLSGVEGEDWDYYIDLAEEAGLSGRFAQGGTYEVLKTYNISSTSSSVGVWLRSANRGYAGLAWHVNSSGNVSGYGGGAYYAYRGCPACKILAS